MKHFLNKELIDCRQSKKNREAGSLFFYGRKAAARVASGYGNGAKSAPLSLAFRRTRRTSVDVATGRGALSRPAPVAAKRLSSLLVTSSYRRQPLESLRS